MVRVLALISMLAAAVLAAAAPSGASAAARGATSIELGGRAFAALEARGVQVRAGGRARLRGDDLTLPLRGGAVLDGAAWLNHRGAVRLARRANGRRRALLLRRIQVRLGRRSRVIATVRGRRLPVFAIDARRGGVSLDAEAETASLRRARVRFTGRARRLVERRLRVPWVRGGRAGRITVDALLGELGTDPGDDGGGEPGGGGPPAGPELPGPPPPPGGEPPVLARPAGAVDVTSATVTWHVRDSWVRYASTEQAGAALNGAVPGAAILQDQHACPDAPASAAPPPLVYSYTLPFAHGWHDAASGRTALYASGGARWRFPSHGIDLEVQALELELGGAAPRVVARFDGRGETDPGNVRAVLMNLGTAAPAPGGPAATVRGTVPSGGAESVFAGFYTPGDGFGCVTVSFGL